MSQDYIFNIRLELLHKKYILILSNVWHILKYNNLITIHHL